MKWKYFSFNNLPLRIPEKWDLTKFNGNAKQGNFVLDDGIKVALDAQWGKCGTSERAVLEDRLVLRQKDIEIKKRVEIDDDRVVYITQSDRGKLAQILILQPELERFIFLRLFNPTQNIPPFVDKMTKEMKGADPEGVQRWDFFATRFNLPAEWLMKTGEMKAGCIKLEFTRKNRELTIWDFSLLETLEKKMALDEFAYSLIENGYKKKLKFFTKLKEEPGEKGEFVVPGRRRRRWMLSPYQLLLGNRKVRLECVVNRERNRFSLILLRYRKPQELEWIDGLSNSLKNLELITEEA